MEKSLVTNNTRFSYLSSIISSVESWSLGSWYNMSVTVDLLQITLYINGLAAGVSEDMPNIVEDSPEYLHTFGGDFIGFLHTLCVHQYVKTTFEVVDSIPNCPVTQNELCQDCDECDKSCIRTTDCRMCLDHLCHTCELYGGPCADYGCIDNAILFESECFCNDPYYYQSDIDACEICGTGCRSCVLSTECIDCLDGYYQDGTDCLLCDSRCAMCLDETNQNCQMCSGDNVFVPGTTTCEPDCPSGYVTQGNDCNLPEDPTILDHCFVFTDKILNTTINQITISTKPDPNSHPIPMLYRGLYFDGDDELLLQDLVLSTSFTVECWLRPYVDQFVEGDVLTVNGDVLMISIVNAAPRLSYTQSVWNSQQVIDKAWTNVGFVIDLLDIKMYINNSLTDGYSETLNSIVIDLKEYSHIIGTNYIGFIHSICIKNRATTSFDITSDHACTSYDCT